LVTGISAVLSMAASEFLSTKAGGVALPKAEKPQKVATHPHLTYKEAFVALIIILALLLFSIFVDAPLLDKAKPTVSPNPSKAPWYFMGFQELLMHVHPVFGSFIIPLAVTIFFIAIPFLKYSELKPGVWFHSPKGKKITITSAIFSDIFTFVFVIINDTVFDFSNRLADWPSIISTGFLPTLLYLIPASGFILFVSKRYQANCLELIMGIVSIILSAYITMTLTGSLLRGEGMQLIF